MSVGAGEGRGEERRGEVRGEERWAVILYPRVLENSSGARVHYPHKISSRHTVQSEIPAQRADIVLRPSQFPDSAISNLCLRPIMSMHCSWVVHITVLQSGCGCMRGRIVRRGEKDSDLVSVGRLVPFWEV